MLIASTVLPHSCAEVPPPISLCPSILVQEHSQVGSWEEFFTQRAALLGLYPLLRFRGLQLRGRCPQGCWQGRTGLHM